VIGHGRGTEQSFFVIRKSDSPWLSGLSAGGVFVDSSRVALAIGVIGVQTRHLSEHYRASQQKASYRCPQQVPFSVACYFWQVSLTMVKSVTVR